MHVGSTSLAIFSRINRYDKDFYDACDRFFKVLARLYTLSPFSLYFSFSFPNLILGKLFPFVSEIMQNSHSAARQLYLPAIADAVPEDSESTYRFAILLYLFFLF